MESPRAKEPRTAAASNSAPTRDGGVSYWGVADDGAVVEIVAHGATADLFTAHWPPLGLTRADRPGRPARLHLVVEPGGAAEELTVTVDGEPSWGGWERVESELALFASERLAGLVAIHAAVIVVNQRALVVPGTSGAGKSTLCVAAAEAGATILTDEYALVDPTTGWVTGWHRAVRVRQPDGSVDRLDLAEHSDPVRVGLVALVTHDPSAEAPWASINGAEAVMGLLANTVCARSRADEALDAALAIARSARAVAGPRGEATQAIRELLALLDEPAHGGPAG